MKKILLTIVSLYMLSGICLLRAENIGVPAECEDVMLQGFYWGSYKDNAELKYRSTKWSQLSNKSTAKAICGSFDLVWLPPSAQSTGGVGYYHTCLSNQNSDWGSDEQLNELIESFHNKGTKVLADIVINHRNGPGWCTFYKDNFGEGYGTFEFDTRHICYGDECFTNSSSSCYKSSQRGNYDTGTNDGGCRDLDHASEYVQTWAKTYVRWMREVMKYDGFRYDMTRGYAGKYLSMYNEEAQPYLSVSEFWTGIDEILTHLYATNYNTMAFDFPLKYVMNSAFNINDPDYSLLRNPGNSLRNKGKSRYAVTFIDNHDTFERDEEDACNQEFLGCKVNLDNEKIKDKILQANAYILMMPGVPCVFWPHWNKYKSAIQALIEVRKLAGIHSQSAVSGEKASKSGEYYYATIQGHRASVILRLGPGRPTNVPEGYHLALDGATYNSEFSIYISDVITGVEEVKAEQKGRKFIKDGQLYIMYDGQMYDVLGRKVKE